MKKIILFTALLFFTVHSFSQANIQLYGSDIHNLNRNYKATTKGVGFRIELGRDDRWVTKYFGIAYDFPMYPIVQWEARAFSNTTDPSFVDVTARYKQPMVRLEAGYNLYPIGGADKFKGASWFFNGGIEGIYIGNKGTYSYFDQDKYTLGVEENSGINPDGTDKYGLDLHISLGTGIEIGTGPGNIVLHGSITLPTLASGQTGADLDSFTPIPLNVNLGYKILLGKK